MMDKTAHSACKIIRYSGVTKVNGTSKAMREGLGQVTSTFHEPQKLATSMGLINSDAIHGSGDLPRYTLFASRLTKLGHERSCQPSRTLLQVTESMHLGWCGVLN